MAKGRTDPLHAAEERQENAEHIIGMYLFLATKLT